MRTVDRVREVAPPTPTEPLWQGAGSSRTALHHGVARSLSRRAHHGEHRHWGDFRIVSWGHPSR